MRDFSFSPENGLENVEQFPTTPKSEQEARQQIQTPLNQIKEFINSTIVPSVTNWENFKIGDPSSPLESINVTNIKSTTNKVNLTTKDPQGLQIGVGIFAPQNKEYVFRPHLENNGEISLGISSGRWKDLYLTGNISTSDGSLNLGAGDINVSNGSLTVHNGNITFGKGDLKLSHGDITVSEGDLKLGSSALTGTGYSKLPNGLLMQWGALTSCEPNTTHTINFPKAFPKQCFNIQLTFAGSTGQAPAPAFNTLTSSSFKVIHAAGGKATIYWSAIGI